MNLNESFMKDKGEKKVWNTILSKSGNLKAVGSIQIGQQLLLDESLRVLPLIRDWIDNTSAKVYRGELQGYFYDDDILLEKILQTYVYLAGAIYSGLDVKRSRVNKSRHKKINTLKKNIFPTLSFDQVWRFTEVVIEYSAYFGVETLLNHKEGGMSWNVKYVCHLNETILDKLAFEAAKAFYPLPMTTPPVDWSFDGEELVGGYEDYQFEMVRAAPRVVDYSKYSPKIFSSVNYIQSVPWIVNEDILRQLQSDLKLPLKEDFIKTEYPDTEPCRWDLDLKEEHVDLTKRQLLVIEQSRKAFKDQVELFKAECSDYESALGKYRAIKMAVEIAEMYKHEIIYFPHSFDFRGRIYPLAVGLSPQGSDAVKALLLYKNKEELTQRGIEWNWAYLASLYGDDKLPFDQRIERGKQLLHTDYKEADEPYQFLSHQLELIKWTSDPNYIPNTRIHLDACNSGSQFTSAITGDRDGCIATNVIPSINEDGIQDRKDAYLLVAQKSLELADKMILEEDDIERKQVLTFLRDLLVDDGRKICKVPVMVSNYGGTSGGRSEILWNMLRELQVERKWITKRNAALFSKIIGESIVGVLNGGKAFESYIHIMNNLIAKGNNAVEWITDDGFHVVHIKNKELKAKQVSCMLPGARKSTTITKKVFSDKVSSAKMKSAISPNYIHSLDAELLRRVAMKMRSNGIVDSDWIHDSFGCHPNHVDLMLDITKNEFAKLVRRAPLRTLHKQLSAQVPDTKKTQKELQQIKIPHLRGFDTANGDLDIVKQSDWFFS